MNETIFGQEQDTLFMKQALVMAQHAFDADEVPIGAVVVDQSGAIIGRGCNKVEKLHTQAAHAEMEAISRAGASRNDWRMNGCWLFVTLEPCSMCISMILLSRVSGLIFAAPSPLFGYHLDKDISYQVYKRDALVVIEGVCKQESVDLLQSFFNKKRKQQ